jgi:ABC-type dipeptide/oligopeptide/nickel transport system permease component
MSFATGAPVADLMSERLANTARLGIAAALISVPLALGMGNPILKRYLTDAR